MTISQICICLAIAVYLIAMLGVGVWFSKRNNSVDDFYLGGRKLGPFVTAMSAEASDMSSWLLMGLPGVAYLSGLAEASWTAIGLAVGTYLNWLIVARRIRRYSHQIDAITAPQFFSKRWGDERNLLSAIAAVVIMIFFVPYLASGFSACGKLFASLFGINYVSAMLISAAVIVIYTVMGGFLAASFTDLVQSIIMTVALVVVLGFGVCSLGLQNGVEKITKAMMVCLLLLMVALAVRSVTLPGADEGLKFYLVPDFGRLVEQGVGNVVYAAMGQAFFTLSLGIGAMAIFGSYIGKERTLLSESVNITLLDTFVALMAGLIIFPACFSFGVNPGQGPGLVFVTLPNIFGGMAGGRVWGALFFVFMSFAALSTVIAVFENIVAFGMDLWGWSRKKAVLVNFFAILVLSLPCVLGYNVLSGFMPFGEGSAVLDLEDFLVSNTILPLGSLVYLLFCTSRYGWGWKNFVAEADEGKGIRFPKWARVYVSYVLPLIVLFIFLMGYKDKFFT